MTEIARIVQTCDAAPSQWEGFLIDGSVFYVRYRHGLLSFYTHATDPLAEDATVVIDRELISPGDGHMSYADLRGHLRRHQIASPAHMDSETTWHPGIVPSLTRRP